MNAIDIDRARAQTPGCANVLHFDNAGSSLLPIPVFQAVVDHLELEQKTGGALAVRERLLCHNINVSVSKARSARLDMDGRGLTASVHYFNTVDEIERFCGILDEHTS